MHIKFCNFVYEEYFTQPKDEKQKQYLEDKNKCSKWRYEGDFVKVVCSSMKGKIIKLQGRHKEFLNISLD